MYFKNKATGITWHITDKTHIKRLESDTNYIKVSHDKGTDKDEKPSNSTVDWHELRKIAADKGINTKGLKRDQIEKELAKIGDADVTK